MEFESAVDEATKMNHSMTMMGCRAILLMGEVQLGKTIYSKNNKGERTLYGQFRPKIK